MYTAVETVPDIDIFCSICFQTVGPGIRHPCYKAATIENLKKLLASQGLNTAEQVIFQSLKEMKETQSSNTVQLSTGGPKLTLS